MVISHLAIYSKSLTCLLYFWLAIPQHPATLPTSPKHLPVSPFKGMEAHRAHLVQDLLGIAWDGLSSRGYTTWDDSILKLTRLTNFGIFSKSTDQLWNPLSGTPELLLRNPVEPDLALQQSLPEPCPEPSPEPCWTWPGSAPKPPRTFYGTFSGTLLNLTWLCTEASRPSPELLLRNSFSGIFSGTFSLLNLTWFCTKASPTSGTFAGTFSGTLLNVTWLCTKASQTFSGTFSGTLLNLTWLCTKASQNLLRNLLWNPVELDLALHRSLQTFSGTPSPESSPEPSPCWTWPGSAPKPPQPPEPSPEPSPEPCWTWPGSAPKPPRPSPEPSLEPCWTWPGSAPKPPRTFYGTFSGTLLNLTWLCTEASRPSPELLLRNLLPVEPDLVLHQSLPNLRNLLRNLLRNSVEPDLALHQGFGTFSGTFFRTFSGTLLNVTWLCTKNFPDLLRNLRNLFRNLAEPNPAPAPVHTRAILGWRLH